MVDASSFNLNPTFPMASVIDAAANKTYKEQLMRNQQQELLMKGLDQFSSGVNNLVNRKIAIAQALAQAKLYGPMMGQLTAQPQQAQAQPQPQPQSQALPNEITDTSGIDALRDNQPIPMGPPTPVPGAVGGIDTAGHAASMPPVPSPLPSSNPVDQQTLAQALYTGAPQNPAEMIANLLKSQGLAQEKAYQIGQLGLGQGQLALDTAYKSNMLKLDNAKMALEEKLRNQEIGIQEANNLRSTLASLEQKQAELTKNLPSGLYGGLTAKLGWNQAAKSAQDQMAAVSSQIDNVASQLGMGSKSSGPYGQSVVKNGKTYIWSPETGKYHPK